MLRLIVLLFTITFVSSITGSSPNEAKDYCWSYSLSMAYDNGCSAGQYGNKERGCHYLPYSSQNYANYDTFQFAMMSYYTQDYYKSSFMVHESIYNLILSPLSTYCLAGLLESASTLGSDSRKELLTFFGNYNNSELLEDSYHRLMKDYENFNDIIRISTSLRSEHHLKKHISHEFIERAKEDYSADIYFTPETAYVKVDSEFNPEDRSSQLLKAIYKTTGTGSSIDIVTNLHFKGKWTIPFVDATEEKDQLFRFMDDSMKAVATMKRTDKSFYVQKCKVQNTDLVVDMVKIPFEEHDSRFSLVIALPENIDKFFEILHQIIVLEDINNVSMPFTTKLFSPIMGFEPARKMSIFLPKFTISDSFDIMKIFEDMGVSEIFKDKHGLSKMSDVPVHINSIKHNILMDIDTDGVNEFIWREYKDNAADTEKASSNEESEEDIFRVNRPFFVSVVDQIRELPVYFGHITRPIAL